LPVPVAIVTSTPFPSVKNRLYNAVYCDFLVMARAFPGDVIKRRQQPFLELLSDRI
jgi:hypothetical protein